MENYQDKPYTFDRVVRLVISALLVFFGLYFLYIVRDALLPFLIAWLIAYMLNPIVRFIHKKLHIAHSLAVVITLVLVFGGLVGIGFALSPLIEDEISQINHLITNYKFVQTGDNDELSITIAEVIGTYVDFEELKTSLSKETIIETIRYISPAVRSLFSNTISFIISIAVVFIIILYLIFILLDYDKINELWQTLIPRKHRPIVHRITTDVEYSMNKYFRHQAFICCILAILYAVGFQVIGLPTAIIFGIIVGLIHMIPYLQVVTFPVAILLCWLRASQTDDSFWVMIGLTALVYIVVQCIMDLFLVPKIMGKAMGLNPAIILLSLSIWGSLLGIVGMIIAIPLTTLLLSYYKEILSSYDEKNKRKEMLNPEHSIPPDKNEN